MVTLYLLGSSILPFFRVLLKALLIFEELAPPFEEAPFEVGFLLFSCLIRF